MASVFCLKITLRTTWSQSVVSQIFKTYQALRYNLTTHCGIFKPLLQIIFDILSLFSTHCVNAVQAISKNT